VPKQSLATLSEQRAPEDIYWSWQEKIKFPA